MKLIILSTILLLFCACKKEDKQSSIDYAPSSPLVDIYVAGVAQSGSVPQAVLWKNDTTTYLTNGVNPAAAKSVAVKNGDVYVAGYESNGTKNVAKLWKNESVFLASNGSQNASFNSLFLTTDSIYIAGEESNGTKNIAKYWKDGVATALSDGTNDASATSIFVSGNDVYVTTYEYDGTHFIAKIYKNGTSTTLNGSSPSAAANAVFVSGSNVYVAGSITNSYSQAVIWKNTVMTKLFNGTLTSNATSLFVQNGNLLIGGHHSQMNSGLGEIDRAFLKNNSSTTYYPLVDDASAVIYSIAPIESDLYAAGTAYGNTNMACYWKNGEIHYLSNGSNVDSANSIFVVRK